MAKKITIQHLYTTGSTTAPTGLIEGEIAISHKSGSEAIFIKERPAEPGKTPEEIKFIPEVRIKKMFEEAGIGSNDVITGLSKQLSDHIDVSGDTSNFGHVRLVSGGVENIAEYKTGEAAAAYHTHGQYLEESLLNTNKGFQYTPALGDIPKSYSVKAGTGINVDSNGVSINDEYQGKIASGATAYGWGDHKTAGYADNNDLTALRNDVTAHTSNTTVHVTQEEKTDWNAAVKRINTFLDVETGATEALDSLHEIQEYLTGSGNSVNTLLESLNNLTDTVSGNTNSISGLSLDVTTLIDESANYIKTLGGDKHIKVGKLPGVSQTWIITHNSASTENATITATNDTTGLSFGSEFKIVDKIGYDANGHVVSGSTQVLKLPVIPQASSGISGIVTTTYGDLKDYTDIPTKSQLYYAAHRNHTHSQYVRLADLNGNTGDIITISCGTY